jgi:hypothetical protein
MNTIHAGLVRWSRGGRHWAAAALLSLVACGGGVELGGTGTGSVIVGPVSGFGSIVVDGIRIDESNAQFRNADGVAVPRDAVKLGSFVEAATGPITANSAGDRSATALSVQIRTELRGPLQAIDLAAMRVTVLGQVVTITANTVIDGGAASLAVGQVVEIHGSQDVSTQRFVATRIEAASAGADFKVRGVAQSVTSAPPRLSIAGQGYDLERTGIPAGVVDGSFVELRVESVQRGGLWVVTKAKADDRALPDGQSTELEGTVSAFTSATQFGVNGTPVDARAVKPEGPAVALGVRVKVKGTMVNGVLQASSVSVKSDNGGGDEIQLNDVIASVNTASQTFVVRGVTVFYGLPSLDTKGGTIADIAAGRKVEVKGALDSDGLRVVARKIEFLSN